MKKAVSVLLCIIIALTLLPVTSNVAYTQDDPPPGGGGEQCSITLEYIRDEGRIIIDGRDENPGVYYFDKGSNIPVIIEAEPGYQVSAFVVDGTTIAAIEYTFNNLSEDHTVSATFEPAVYTITASAGEGGSIEPEGTITAEHGSNKTFNFTPNPGYEVEEVIINGYGEGSQASYELQNIQQDHTIHVNFKPTEPQQHLIRLIYNHDQGNVLINGMSEPDEFNVDNGDSLNIDIEARDGFIISTVQINDGDPVNVNARQYPMQFENISDDITIRAEFTPITYTITATAGENGTISPSGNVTVDYDQDKWFTITPDSGYKIDEVLVDDEPVWIPDNDKYGCSYEFRHVRENHSISASFAPRGNGSIHTITVDPAANGTIAANGLTDGIVTVQDSFDITFIITPDPGYGLLSVMVNDFDEMGSVVYNNGAFELTLREVSEDLTLSAVFIEESIEGILCKSYAVLEDEAVNDASLKNALMREFGYMGFAVSSEKIVVSDVDISGLNTVGYGTFKFTFQVGTETSDEITGYIVSEFSDVIFKFEGSYKGSPIGDTDKIRVARAEDGENGIFSAPAMDDGSIEIIGPYNTHTLGWTSPDVRDAFDLDGNRMIVLKSFYRVQLHIGNTNHASPGSPDEYPVLNWFAFDLLQDDAYCVKVDAKSDAGKQRTLQWELNRYAIINTGEYVSEVFFGNDTFELSIPEEGIGAVTEISLETGDFQGYSVSETEPDRKYEVSFKSDFYDRVVLDVTINNSEVRQLTVHRVGVNIQKEVYNPDRGPDVNLSHGTQFGTKLDFSDGSRCHIYATYCIPDGGTTAPYGLYVTYTFADGTRTSEIITEPCNNPPENMNAREFSNGVFIYDENAACCDYLIYSAEDGTNAPVKVCVTVLKGDPLSGDDFDGIFFGSGAGVEWINE